MNGTLIVDTNILVLLAVGGASKAYIADHKNTRDHFNIDDFDLITLIIAGFSEILLVPHIAAEASNLVRQIGDPKRKAIQTVLARWISLVLELPVASVIGCQREEYLNVGVTDAVILHLCRPAQIGISPTLLTIDSRLANHAGSLGYSVIDYRREFQAR